MDPDRSHGSSNSSSSSNNMRDLFICFTSVPSSLGRRKSMVRSNSSLKSGQASSSMFFNGKKKGFEKNPEPSSPKVTCIGQVRAKKSKKQEEKLRACRSIRNGTEVNSCKKWVHLPLTICEALRGFGAQYFECFLPCTSDKQDKTDVRSDNETLKEQTLNQVSFDLEKLPHGEENGESVAQKGGSTSTVEEEVAEIEITQKRSELECPDAIEPDPEDESSISQQDSLPDCLVLMMYEPKLSMEVSKETWVCKKDFIRQPLVKHKEGGDEPQRRTIVASDPVQVLLQPSSSSCPFPAAVPSVAEADTGSCPLPATPPLATTVNLGNVSGPLPATPPLVMTANLGNVTGPLSATPPLVMTANLGNVTGSGGCTPTNVNQKLVGGKGYEPFVLTRCMSEPVRSSAKLAKAW